MQGLFFSITLLKDMSATFAYKIISERKIDSEIEGGIGIEGDTLLCKFP